MKRTTEPPPRGAELSLSPAEYLELMVSRRRLTRVQAEDRGNLRLVDRETGVQYVLPRRQLDGLWRVRQTRRAE